VRSRRFIIALVAAVLAALVSAQASWALSAEDGVIAYQPSQDNTTWVMNPDGTDQHLLMDNVVGSVAWSPDGGRIAFDRAVDGQLEIWMAKADGDGQHLAIKGGFLPAWTPDGRLVYTVQRPLGTSIVVADPNGSHVRTLVKPGVFTDVTTPLVLPTGRMIVSARGITPPLWATHQFTLDRTGRNLRPLDNPIGQDNVPVMVIDAAPGGRRIAIYDEANGEDVWELGTLTGNTVTIDRSWARYTFGGGGLTWSPAGDALLTDVVTSRDPNDPYQTLAAQLGLLNTDGGLLALIGPTNTGRWFWPSWQPRCTVTVADPNSVVQATAGRDRICVTASRVTLHAGRGNDLIWVYGSHDRIIAGHGRDIIAIHGSGSTVHAGRGADLINTRDAHPGTNTVNGGRGHDVCIAGNGDTIHC
jgi:RTX calcium-binding nonapeptide repeat (4 copies)/WD40-like Beta Propeller Repeat